MTAEINALSEKLDAIANQQRELLEALLGSARPGSAPGLIRRADESDRELFELRRRLEELAASVRAIEATPGKTAITWWDRVGMAFLGIVLTAFAGIIGARLNGGMPH